MGLLESFTDEQIALLQAELAQRTGDRSAFRPRQLNNLMLPPTKDDPRPTFFWSADPPRNAVPQRAPYRKLKFHRDTGTEICVKSEAEEAALGPEWQDKAPRQVVLTAKERAEQLFAQLSPEDQALVLEHEREKRIKEVSAALDGVSKDTAATVLGTAKRRKKEAVA